MSVYAYSVSQALNNHTVSALPTGSGNYGDMYQLTKADGTSTFYAHIYQQDEDISDTVRLTFEGFEVNTSHPLPVAIITGGGGGSGSLGTTTTPNVSTIGDPTAPSHQAAVLIPGSSGTYALSIQGVTSGLAVAVSGTFWQATQPVSGTFWQATQPISVASLPLPSGAATAAKQPALGTAGSASSDVITIQGIASMTSLKIDGSAVTQPVSAASLPLPAGASTAAKQPALGTAGTPSTDVLSIQGVASAKPIITSNSGSTTSVNAVAASSTVATALSANAARLKWVVTNDTAVIMYVKIGTAASTSSYSYALSPKTATSAGGSCEGQDTTAITVILGSGSGNAMVTEVTA
jgi:hypothetical protein